MVAYPSNNASLPFFHGLAGPHGLLSIIKRNEVHIEDNSAIMRRKQISIQRENRFNYKDNIGLLVLLFSWYDLFY